jgi:hypothetical protein
MVLEWVQALTALFWENVGGSFPHSPVPVRVAAGLAGVSVFVYFSKYKFNLKNSTSFTCLLSLSFYVS